MTAPRTGHDNATVRGAVVLIVAIVIGLALLARSGDSGDAAAATTTTRAESPETIDASVTSSTLAPIAPETTASPPAGPDDTRPPEEVTAVVLNGTTANVGGAAGESSETVGAGGYSMLDPSDAVDDFEITTIYALPEFQADAEAIRGLLGLPDTTIEVKPEESLGARADDADIVVVIGDDIAPA